MFNILIAVESQDLTNLINVTEPENAAFPRIQEASTGTDEEQKKDAALHSCCNGGPFDLVVPEQNGGDYYISTELNEDNICRIPSAADAGQLVF